MTDDKLIEGIDLLIEGDALMKKCKELNDAILLEIKRQQEIGRILDEEMAYMLLPFHVKVKLKLKQIRQWLKQEHGNRRQSKNSKQPVGNSMEKMQS